MITQHEIEERLLGFVSEEVFRGRKQITLDTDLVSAGFDSMSLVSLLLFVERDFKVWMSESGMTAEVLANIRTVAGHVLKHVV